MSRPFTLALAVTGFCLSWHEETRWVARWAFPVSERLHLSLPARMAQAAPISVDAALSHVERHTRTQVDSIVLLPRQGLYGVRSFDDRDLDGIGRLPATT